MELKNYQQKVIEDLGLYLKFVLSRGDIGTAFLDYWAEKGVALDDGKKAYKDEKIPNVPNVCIKVPTAGGKTYIGVNAIKTIFDKIHYSVPDHPKLVVWLVPSQPIMQQTLKALSDPDHPYRKRLDLHHRRRVNVLSKESMLIGAGFTPDSIQEELTIVVMTYASIKSSSKDGRNVFKDNGYLERFTKIDSYGKEVSLIEGVDQSALINVVRNLRPVVIVDESHNAESTLSMEMLKDLNPDFVLDLTATPKEHSNIISYVDAKSLKLNDMVKLPVIVANRSSTEEVIESAYTLRRRLEEIACNHEKNNGGKYIRPIVLFQAQPNKDDESITFESIKKKLIAIGIPEDQIKIKASGIDELKDVNLMSRECSVRYILTVNALKEGWDCPFAYILASLANKSSSIDVEQVLGRILRMPYTHKHDNPFLNESYVFTSSNSFSSTLENIVKALNNSGFSDKDYRSIDPKGAKLSEINFSVKSVLNADDDHANELFSAESLSKKIREIDERMEGLESDEYIDELLADANKKSSDFNLGLNYESASTIPNELVGKLNHFKLKEIFQIDVSTIKIPQFVRIIRENCRGWLDDQEQAFEKNELLKNFKLASCDSSINFDDIDAEVYKIDLEEHGIENYAPKPYKLNSSSRKRFNDIILSGNIDCQKRDVAARISQMIGDMYPISDPEISIYVSRIIDGFTDEQIRDCLDRDIAYVRKIKEKIVFLAETHAKYEFDKLVKIGIVETRPWFKLPSAITPSGKAPSIPKSLYTDEAQIGAFELSVIIKIANLQNIKWWHRNLSRGKGFRINGFINHYPDFIIMTNSGILILLETKGGDRDNSDSEQKLLLGNTWANAVGKSYRYLMVFDTNEINGAYSVADAISIISAM